MAEERLSAGEERSARRHGDGPRTVIILIHRSFFYFSPTTNATASYTVNGVAPVEVKEILMGGGGVAWSWTSVTNWTFTTTLFPGTNTIVVQGYGPNFSPLEPRDIGPYAATNTVYY